MTVIKNGIPKERLIARIVRFWHQCADECLLLGAKRTLTKRCLPISIYEYTA